MSQFQSKTLGLNLGYVLPTCVAFERFIALYYPLKVKLIVTAKGIKRTYIIFFFILTAFLALYNYDQFEIIMVTIYAGAWEKYVTRGIMVRRSTRNQFLVVLNKFVFAPLINAAPIFLTALVLYWY